MSHIITYECENVTPYGGVTFSHSLSDIAMMYWNQPFGSTGPPTEG